MPTLHVHLREGFEKERVVVYVNDAVALDVPDVRTRPQLGLAGMHEVSVPAGRVDVRVELPGRGRSLTTSVDAARTPYLGVSVGPQGDPDVVSTATAFGYV